MQDRRFAAPEWRHWPFNLLHQVFLLNQQWWSQATHGVSGVDKHHENVVAFAARQWLDMLSPGNHLLTNPEALARTVAEDGANLQRGLAHLLDDLERSLAKLPPAGATPASTIAAPIDRCFQRAQAIDDGIEGGRLADEHAGTDHALEVIAQRG